MARKQRKLRITGREKLLYTLGVICFIAVFATKIFFGAQVSNTKMTIEQLNYKIDTQEKKNESLTMQINELTSYENVSNAIKDLGLAFNNENIIVINK